MSENTPENTPHPPSGLSLEKEGKRTPTPDVQPALTLPPPTPEPTFAPEPASPVSEKPGVLPPQHGPVVPRLPGWVMLALGALALVMAWLAWSSLNAHQHIGQMQQILAQRLAEGDQSAQHSLQVATKARDALGRLEEKLGALEGQVAGFEGEKQALEALHHEFVRSRDERLLAEIEQSLRLATEQLHFTGNVEATQMALTAAYQKIAAAPLRFAPLREALGQDIERLQALPRADIPALATQLSSLAARMSELPIAHETAKPPAQDTAKGGEPAAHEALPLLESAQKAFEGWSQWLSSPGVLWEATQTLARDVWGELRGMVRLERLDQPLMLPASPEQGVLLRENLKIRLLLARFALLSRDTASYEADLMAVKTTLESRFDPAHPGVLAAMAELNTLLQAPIAPPRFEPLQTREALRVLETTVSDSTGLPVASDRLPE